MKHLLSAKGKVIAGMLTMFGVAGCDDPPVCEYGCPYAEFNVHGTVTDELSHPLGGIAVSAGYASDTTDSDGRYDILTDGVGRNDAPTELFLSDVDSSRNPRYADTVVPISFDNVEPQGADGRWNDGTFTLQKDIRLNKR